MTFKQITDEERHFYVTEMPKAIRKNYLIAEGELNTYKVKLQRLTFVCGYTEDEMQNMTDVCIDILELLKKHNNEGLTKDKLRAIQEECSGDDSFISRLKYNSKVCTSDIENQISRLCKITRVGGAYAMILSIPVMKDSIVVVFEVAVDKWDDEEMYQEALYFLVRSAMHMHCDEISEKDNENIAATVKETDQENNIHTTNE